jgi:hypothetical protein
LNQFSFIGMVTRETLRVLENQLTFTLCVNREYDDYYAKAGAKIGNVLNVRKPVRFSPSSGQGLVLQDLTETTVPVVLNKQYQRSFAVTSSDIALNIDDFSKRFVEKAMISLANEIDFDGLAQTILFNNEVGTPGTVPTDIATYLAAAQRLSENAAPMDERYAILSPGMNAAIIKSLAGLFNPQVMISGQNRKGLMAKDTFGLDWYMDQNVQSFTTGAFGGTPLVNGLNQSGASLITNGWTAAAAPRVKKGDVFTIAGVFAVNPQSKQSTGALAQFVATADVSSDGAGNATIPINPAIIGPGTGPIVNPFQNVSVLPTTGNALTFQGAATTTSPRGFVFHPDAITFANADLPLYGGLDMGDRKTDDQLKMSMRVIRDYDINLDRAPLRIDLLGGWAPLYFELGVRIAS